MHIHYGVCLHHGPWSRPKVLENLWVVVEFVLGLIWFTLRTKCQSDHGVWGPQKTCFDAHIFHRHGSSGVLQWERQKGRSGRKRQGAMAKKHCYNKFWMTSFLGKRRRRQEKTKEWSNLNFVIWTYPCWTYIKKISTFTFGCMVILPLGSHLVYT